MPPSEAARAIPNRLLVKLDPADYRRIAPHLEDLLLEHRQVLHAPWRPIRYVYFPCGAMVSLMMVMADGNRVETAVVGHEGMVGTSIILGARRMHDLAQCQTPGPAKRMKAAVLRAEIERGNGLAELLCLHMRTVLMQIAQSVACNRLHTVQQRCARWLLNTCDRVGPGAFSLTQDYLAAMLGVRRASVTVAAAALQDEGLIRYRHGVVHVLDRVGLERVACECYGVVAAESHRLLGAPRRPRGNAASNR
jgi:hypothetical protein